MIFTSDNGGVLDDGYQDGSGNDTQRHRPNGALRGFKGSLFEGGHRVPFIARWPGKIPVGQADELICHVDLLATSAAPLGQSLPDDAAADSVNVLPALHGEGPAGRDHLVHHTGGFPAGWRFAKGIGNCSRPAVPATRECGPCAAAIQSGRRSGGSARPLAQQPRKGARACRAAGDDSPTRP